MLNPSDVNLIDRADDADHAQFLRGSFAFGAVAFCESALLGPDQVQVEARYGDCLPIIGGGYWRDPASVRISKAIKETAK